MRYLILINGEAFYTNWYDYKNHYVEGMTVFDLSSHSFSTDGWNFIKIKEDNL